MWLRQTAVQAKRRLRGRSPFGGDIEPGRVRLFGMGRPSFPFPHPWNYQEPLRILETFYWGAEDDRGSRRHNRYFDVPGLPLGLVTRDPKVIAAALLSTGDKPGQFDRDTAPARGIARFTGTDTMLYANGEQWRNQKRIAAPPLGQPSLFQPEKFGEFEDTFRKTVMKRLEALAAFQAETGDDETELPIEPEVGAVMLEMLVNNFFGAKLTYEEIRDRYVPAINDLIGRMIKDTVGHQLLGPIRKVVGGDRHILACNQAFNELVDLTLEGRAEGRASWAQFKSDVPDEALRSNIRVFLAGALEATSSFACWAISHLSYRPDLQEEIFAEVEHLDDYSPENLAKAKALTRALEESLRLTPALYFLPRRATVDMVLKTSDDRTLTIPKGTHVVLDVWHSNRHDDFWGPEVTGFPAAEYHPERWKVLEQRGLKPKDMLHFGFGHGPRVCPGKFLGQLEVSLVVGAFVKLFRFEAVARETRVKAGVSTKPADGTVVRIRSR